MVLRHVDFQLLGICPSRRFPARFLCGGVEVIGKVLGVRMANFPSCWKSCVGLYIQSAMYSGQNNQTAAPLSKFRFYRGEVFVLKLARSELL